MLVGREDGEYHDKIGSIESMWKWKQEPDRKKLILSVMSVQVVLLVIYSMIVIAGYSSYQPLVFSENDMQLYTTGGDVETGNYTDTSFEEVKAVVTPAISLKKGVYYMQASLRGQGPIKGGLLYDQPRNGKELFNNNEFRVRPEKGQISFRVRIDEDSPVRLKIRLTGDAVPGDYIQLLDVHVTPSKVTWLYRIFCLAAFLLTLDLLVWGYHRFYKKWSKKQQAIGIVLIVTALFTSLPFFQQGLVPAVDLMFHLQRIEGISQGLLSGQFPVRIHPGWLDGHGYASSIFYGEILMYPSAILRMVGFTVEEAYKFYMFFINGMTVAIAFYAFHKITRNELAAMAGSILYAGNLYRLECLPQATVGRCGAMMFYPLVLAGFYLLFTEDVDSKEYKKIWGYLTLGFTGILMTHMLSGLMVAVYAAVACLLMLKKVFRRNTLLELLKAAGAFILINLWFLVPFLGYMFSEKLLINSKMEDAIQEGADYYALLEDFAQEGKNLYHLVMDRESIGYALLLLLILYVVTIPLQNKADPLTRRSRWLFGGTLFTIWVCMESFPVVGLAKISNVIYKYFTMTQYQIRFMSVAIVFAACMGAVFFAMRLFPEKELWILAGILLCVTVWQDDIYFQSSVVEDYFLDTVDLNFYQGFGPTYSVGNAEYLPMQTDRQQLAEEIVPQEGLTVSAVEREYLTYRITVSNPTEKEQEIKLPVLYYTGYRAQDMDSHMALTTYMGENGCVTVRVPGGYHGRFEMKFYVAWYWRAAEIISLLTLVIGIWYKKWYQNRKGVRGNGDQKSDRPVIS